MLTTKTFSHSALRLLQTIFFLSVILYFGRSFFVPILYGLLIAIILYPVCKKLETRGWPRSMAIAFCLFIVAIFFSALAILLGLQLDELRKDMPELLQKIEPSVAGLRRWAEVSLGFSITAQNALWNNITQSLGNSAGIIISTTLAETAGSMITLFLVPVYVVLFLYNRRTFVRFLEKICGEEYQQKLNLILSNVISAYFNFISGMLMVYLVVGILNSVGLLLLGIKHALLFGMLTAVMTIVPYVGIIISALLPISVAWVTKDSIWYPIAVIGVFGFVQYLEANIIFPKIVGAQLKLSTMATLLAIIAGGLLWGVSGMILFLPFLGIIRILADHLPAWEPLKILLSRD